MKRYSTIACTWDPAISAFRGKNARSGALAAVRAKEVPAGSYLLIEDFDRLSRDFIDNALTLFLEILKAGVSIVTLGFGGRVFNTETLRKDPSAMYISMGSMVRAHEESQRKYVVGLSRGTHKGVCAQRWTSQFLS
jgi:DNA invertase Pin-like site-specific DNA recombinase